MKLAAFKRALRSTDARGRLPLSGGQLEAITHDMSTPLWMIAGPGTGKTHTLCWLVWKRILVDGVDPSRIVLTTFTKKAARELQTRLQHNKDRLLAAGVGEVAKTDLSTPKIGTLHGLCSQILRDERYGPTMRIRVLEDQMSQGLFIRRYRWNIELTKCKDIATWEELGFPPNPRNNYGPGVSTRLENCGKLFNRMTEQMIDPGVLEDEDGDALPMLGRSYRAYLDLLRDHHRTDQASLQRHLLDFMDTPEGESWLDGGFSVMVDEYQDTNAIQEAIYMRLCRGGDITVVGDDDQSLYRFRGARVECLVDFDRACERHLGRAYRPAPVYLSENRRSHPDIVDFVNHFIGSHPVMKVPKRGKLRVRAPNKPPLTACADVGTGYPGVWGLCEQNNRKTARRVAALVEELMSEGMITDYSQVALLSFSTRESNQSIGAYCSALTDLEIPVYNPRSRQAHVDETLQRMLGAMMELLDPGGRRLDSVQYLTGAVKKAIDNCRQQFEQVEMPEVTRYLDKSRAAIEKARRRKKDGEFWYLTGAGGKRVTLSGVFFRLLALEPFASQLDDEVAAGRLRVINGILAEYESFYSNGELRLDDASGETEIQAKTLDNFYRILMSQVAGGLNDVEDDEVSVVPGKVNVMTIHQSKGLEFEVVFVLRPEKQPWESETHYHEDLFAPYLPAQHGSTKRRTADLRAGEDVARLFFVAYSRAKRLLVVAGSKDKVGEWDSAIGVDRRGRPIETPADLEKVMSRA